jgi:hypothetical protein
VKIAKIIFPGKIREAKKAPILRKLPDKWTQNPPPNPDGCLYGQKKSKNFALLLLE